jgi:peptidoglycan-associated lipoprotein
MMMLKRLSAPFGVFLLLLLLTVGCSAFHEVTVVSHGNEVAKGERAKEAAPDSPVEALPVSPLKQEEVEPPLPVRPDVKSIPLTPPIVPPSAKNLVPKEIFAQSVEDTTLPWTLQDVFFDFDQFLIRHDAIPILEQNAKVLLKRYSNRDVLIQGHCDERGTEAYNFILGERRARAVKDYLIALGVADSQLRVLSLGKTAPFCLERTISCFWQNRRAHFVLK